MKLVTIHRALGAPEREAYYCDAFEPTIVDRCGRIVANLAAARREPGALGRTVVLMLTADDGITVEEVEA